MVRCGYFFIINSDYIKRIRQQSLLYACRCFRSKYRPPLEHSTKDTPAKQASTLAWVSPRQEEAGASQPHESSRPTYSCFMCVNHSFSYEPLRVGEATRLPGTEGQVIACNAETRSNLKEDPWKVKAAILWTGSSRATVHRVSKNSS